MRKYILGLLLVIGMGIVQIWIPNPALSSVVYAPSQDPLRGKQSYLDQIGVDAAWAATPSGGKPIIVAIVDTGIDLNHPDLQANLISGINLIEEGEPPQDDFGHGTNVAGVVGAVVNNDTGIAGIARNVKLMPIKALASDGYGDEKHLGEGIRYAIDHGANIVVLSLGLNKQTAYMEEIVRYAEQQNVLLVAAVGNEGNAIKYPAGFQTVLAVGGVGLNKEIEYSSNVGPEIDLVAPWTVYTTALGGHYEYNEGSSMAAPQVAGTAALLWTKYPELSVSQIRNILKQSAEDLHTPGWDSSTGYGLLRADRALTMSLKDDPFEPNDTIEQAKPLSTDTTIQASFSSASDQDWFMLRSDYDGTVTFRMTWDAQASVLLRHMMGNDSYRDYTLKKSGDTVQIKVKKGRNYIMLQAAKGSQTPSFPYQLSTSFQIYADPFEDNDRQYKAFVLPGRSQQITGTFHQVKDQDWFKLHLSKSGQLRVTVSVDTLRIDPVLLFQRKNEKATIIDKKGDGGSETTGYMQVLPGEYYIRVSNIKDYSQPVVGEYTLTIDFTEQVVDPYEPNDKVFQATSVAFGSLYQGVVDSATDIDWFKVVVSKDDTIQFDVKDIGSTGKLTIKLYSLALRELGSYEQWPTGDRVQFKHKLKAGTYFIKIESEDWTDRQPYTLFVQTDGSEK